MPNLAKAIGNVKSATVDFLNLNQSMAFLVSTALSLLYKIAENIDQYVYRLFPG